MDSNVIFNSIQENILIGSILGDGCLSKYGRSKNAYYREHGSAKQRGYRLWKSKQLNMKFNHRYHKVYSQSKPYYTKLLNLFYTDRVKVLRLESLEKLNHPIGLMCLYFDDGSLVIDSYKRKNGLHLFPRIYLYTQSFTLEENILLNDHIFSTFNIQFKLKNVKNGSGTCLYLNKRNELTKFIDLIKPYAKDIPCMAYKINLEKKLKDKTKTLKETCIIDSLTVEANTYTKEDEEQLIFLRKSGYTYKKIASILNRSYYGLVDKYRRLKA